jgi:hypothetical protein
MFGLAEEQARAACPLNTYFSAYSLIFNAHATPTTTATSATATEHCDVGHGNELRSGLVGLASTAPSIDGRPVAGGRIQPAGLGRVLVATLQVSGKSSGDQRDQILVPHVRRLPGSRSAPYPRSTTVFGVRSHSWQSFRTCR